MNFFTKHKWELIASAAMVVAVGIGLAVVLNWPRNPHLNRSLDILRQLTGGKLTPEQRQALLDELKRETEQLTPEDKQKIKQEHDQQVAQREQTHQNVLEQRKEKLHTQISQFFTLTTEAQYNLLDPEIDKLETARKNGDKATEDAIVLRLRQMAEAAAPEDRSLVTKFRRVVDERLKQRGVAPLP
jgi:hypothetical protein